MDVELRRRKVMWASVTQQLFVMQLWSWFPLASPLKDQLRNPNSDWGLSATTFAGCDPVGCVYPHPHLLAIMQNDPFQHFQEQI